MDFRHMVSVHKAMCMNFLVMYSLSQYTCLSNPLVCCRDDFGDSLSGCWLLCSRLRAALLGMLPKVLWQCLRCRRRPGTAPAAPRIMSMGEISGELAYVMAAQRARETADDIDLLLIPPVQEYRTLDFHKADEIVEKGYAYATVQLSRWRASLQRAEAGSDSSFVDSLAGQYDCSSATE